MAIVVPPPQRMTAWSSPGGMPNNAPQNVAGNGPLKVVLRKKVGQGAGKRGAITAGPIIADGRLYVFDAKSTVYAVNPSTGREIWRKSLVPPRTGRGSFFRSAASSAIGGGIAWENGTVYAATGFGNLIALNGQTGQEIWRMDAGSPIHASPLSGGGRVFVTNNDSELFAVDAVTGKVQWTQSAISEPARILSSPSPALVGETIVAPFASGEVIAYLSANGRRLWADALTRAGSSNSLSTINDIAGRPVVAGGIVFAASQSGTFAAIELRTGTRVWEKPIASVQTPWVAGEFVYVVSTTGELVAMNVKNGGVKWTRQLASYRNEKKKKNLISWSGPVMVEGRLVLASSLGRIEVIKPEDGATLFQRDVKSPIFAPSAIADGTIYYYTQDGYVVAVR
ncbi:PQQ-binding-like beta-propeller repeat protein [Candidatus Phycosocius spiralis]|uniref:outer membrane protein assembly factor BamB family protein n=1 Tax=Candidatus Phycosocius spiralis TaxID=2815099 RepID=UPI0024E04362|nr:PQQ-binding-like beta-propeller repeat protein [Candidatus Phycosocius spiralis]